MVWQPEIDELNRRKKMSEQMGGSVWTATSSGMANTHRKALLLTLRSRASIIGGEPFLYAS